MSHREASDILIRHWPLWAAYKIPIIVFAPADSVPRIDPNIPLLLFGRAQHHGVEAVRRFKFLFEFLGRIHADEFWIFESDSFCLSPSALDTALTSKDFYGGVFNIGEDDKSFKGSFYVHPPFGLTVDALRLINELDLSENEERGFWDRWLGYALEILGDRSIDLHMDGIGSYVADGTGMSRNTIEPEDRGAAVKAVESGCVWFHGVKCPLTLTMIQTAYAKRKESASNPASD